MQGRGSGSKGLEVILCQNPQTPLQLKQERLNMGVVCTNSLPPQTRDLPATTTPTPTNTSHCSPAPCHYEGKYFTLGESWLRKDCFHCTCLHPVGVGCCDT